MEQKRWYAVYTRSRAEKKTLEALEKSGIEAYLPLYKTLRQWSDRKKMVELPLIPSYVFVKIEETQYKKVLEVDGIVAFIKFENKLVAIPDQQIQFIKRLVEHGDDLNVISEKVEQGDLVRIASGPLRGTEGEVIETSGKQKFVLRIDIGYTLIVNIQGVEIIKV